jgi:beta-glucanase (GH16 family)
MEFCNLLYLGVNRVPSAVQRLRLQVSSSVTNILISLTKLELGDTDTMLYGKITTRAKVGAAEGVCSGIFFYLNDNSEIDIEILTSYITKSYKTIVPAGEPLRLQPLTWKHRVTKLEWAGIEFTNQPLVEGDQETNTAVPFSFDPTADFHDYTIEWTSDSSKFYVDEQLLNTFMDNVPNVAMAFVLNK